MNGYVPARLLLDGSAPRVEWIVGDGRPYTEPFFEDSLRRLRRLAVNGDGPRVTGAGALTAVGPSIQPTAILFHVSRCGSTLVSRMLATLPGSVVVAEAPVVDDILRGSRIAPIDDDTRVAWLRGAVRAIGGVRSVDAAPERLFLKLDAWHVFHAELVRRTFPDTPLIFLYRHPLEVIVSLLRVPSLALVRGTLTPDQLGISNAERDSLGPEAWAAAVIGAYYGEAARQRRLFVPVDYTRLPDFVWAEMPAGAFTDGEVARLRAAAGVHAKDPSRRFSPDSEDKRASASDAARAASGRWAEPAYETWRRAVADVPA